MKIKLHQGLLLTLLLFTLTAPTALVNGESEPIGIRIINHGDSGGNITNRETMKIINYESFQWVVLKKTYLINLDTLDAVYQVVENPFTLTLGGETFDPLLSEPKSITTWQGTPRKEGAGLHLIQFHGPTKDEWLEALVEDGLQVVQYIHPFTYVVWGELDARDKAAGRDFVRWTGDFLPTYALQPMNRELGEESIHIRAMVYFQADLEGLMQFLKEMGASEISVSSGVDPSFDLLNFLLPGDQLGKAAALPGVYSLQPAPTEGGDRGELSNQVIAGNVDINNRAFTGYQSWLEEMGMSGAGVVIANVDSGIDETHPDLVGQILNCTGDTCGGSEVTSNHGTHTAGIMAGDGTSGVVDASGFLRGLGVAPGANLVEQVYDPTYKQEGGMLTLMLESFLNGAVISGNSWGPSSTPKGYDLDTRLVDIGVRDANPDTPGNQALTYVLSIMNGYGGISTQGTPDEAKNTITVGSTSMQTASGAQLLNINDLSLNTAHGPALDGRIIPHMVAPGCYVDSTVIEADYATLCGTSMASPHVTGAAALFFEYYQNQFSEDPSPALVKAAILSVAVDLVGNRDADGDILGHPFDAKQGWGRLDISAALDPSMSVEYFDQKKVFNKTGQFWTYTLSSDTYIDGIRAMLVWTDAPGHGQGGSTPAWVNDLDLSITIDGQTYYGNNFGSDGFSTPGGMPDSMNNTEGIFLKGIAKEDITITVTAANIAGDGVPNHGDNSDQDFALVIYFSELDPIFNTFFPIVHK